MRVLLIALACLSLSACGPSNDEHKAAVAVCKETRDIWGNKGLYVSYNRIVDYYVCFARNGKELSVIDGRFVTERAKAGDF